MLCEVVNFQVWGFPMSGPAEFSSWILSFHQNAITLVFGNVRDLLSGSVRSLFW